MDAEPLRMPETLPAADGVVLRAFESADLAMLRDLATDPYLALIGSLPHQATDAEALEFIQRQHGRLETGAGYSFCVADGGTGQALGSAGLWLSGLAQGRATAGYSVAPESRGRRVATAALRALTAFGWSIEPLFRIELYIEPWNLGSIRTAKAAGYVREGLLRSHQPIGDRRADMVLFAAIRPDLGTVATAT